MLSKLLFFLCILIVVSSCHTIKYTERGDGSYGFYPTNTATLKKTNNTSSIAIASKQQNYTDTKVPADSVTSLTELKTKIIMSGTATMDIWQPNENKKTTVKPIIQLRKINKSILFQKNKKDNPEEGSIRWFIYLILCFVLPPLAYYLIKRQTDILFWICFFCFLLTTTFFGGFRYGLLGLLSIVIALLTLFQIDI